MGTKILVVDDSATIRQQLNIFLTKAGFTIVEAMNGQVGLEVLKAEADIQMIISDVKMPVMGGMEMVEAIKGLGTYDHIPIVMLTTEGSTDLIEKAKKLGVKGWFVKPLRPDLLLPAVTRLTAPAKV